MLAEIVHPNWHVLLLHFPIALLVIGTLMEVFSRYGSSSRTGGRWMILWGALLAVPTALSGAYAYREVAATGQGVDLGQQWHETVASSQWSEVQWEFLSRHVWLNSIATVIALIVVFVSIAVRDRTRDSWRIAGVVGLVVSVGLMLAGAWHGGEAVYRLGTAVNPIEGWPEIGLDVSLLQVHVTGAGFGFALLILALARTLHWPRADLGTGETETVQLRGPALRPLWGVGALLVAGVAFGGYWMVAGSFEPDAFERWWNQVGESKRMLAHTIVGVSLLVLAIGGIAAPRTIARSGFGSGIYSGLVVIAIAAQIWVGCLMLFDSPQGPLSGFAAPSAEAPAESAEDQEPETVEASADRNDASGPVDAAASGDTAPALVVEMTGERRYEPAEATVEQGAVVRWKNVSDVAHTVTTDATEAVDAAHASVPDGAEPFDSGDIEPGATWSHRFTVPGRYRYFCKPHEARGMLGTIVVEPAEK